MAKKKKRRPQPRQGRPTPKLDPEKVGHALSTFTKLMKTVAEAAPKSGVTDGPSTPTQYSADLLYPDSAEQNLVGTRWYWKTASGELLVSASAMPDGSGYLINAVGGTRGSMFSHTTEQAAEFARALMSAVAWDEARHHQDHVHVAPSALRPQTGPVQWIGAQRPENMRPDLGDTYDPTPNPDRSELDSVSNPPAPDCVSISAKLEQVNDGDFTAHLTEAGNWVVAYKNEWLEGVFSTAAIAIASGKGQVYQ